MCKAISKKDNETDLDFENIQTKISHQSYNSKEITQENINVDLVDEQTNCFVLGYN